MKVIICGDRNWSNKTAIKREILKLPKGTTIIHGGASGADTIAGIIGKQLGFKVIRKNANWNLYGKGAGPIRNTLMLKLNPTLVLAFHSNIEESKGTKDMIKQAKDKGVKVKLFKE